MRLFKIINHRRSKAKVRWVLCTNSFSRGKVFEDLSNLNKHELVPGRTPWKEWLAEVTILSEYKISSISDLLNQIPEEFI